MSLKDEILALADENEIIDPKRVVEWARHHPESKLHASIEWNDKEAADEYRLFQARRLIVLHTQDVYRKPTVVSLTSDRVNGGGYRPLENVIADEELRDIALRDAITFLERAYERYSYLVELAGVGRELQLVKTRLRPRPPTQPTDEPRLSA